MAEKQLKGANPKERLTWHTPEVGKMLTNSNLWFYLTVYKMYIKGIKDVLLNETSKTVYILTEPFSITEILDMK